jgi:hypothetical protein
VSQWIYQTYSLQKAQSIVIISEEDVDTVQEMARPQARVTKDRKLVLELRDQVLKVARCHYIEEFLREDLPTEIPRRSLESMFPL